MLQDPDFTAPPNLDAMLAAPASHGAWRIRALAAMVTVVAVCVLLAQLAWPRLMHPAAQAPTSYRWHVASNVTWASFAVTIGHVHTAFAAHTDVVLTFSTGAAPYQVQVVATAPPFNTRQCRLTIPPAKNDTCAITPAQPTPLLVFAFGLVDLPIAQQHVVTALVTDGITQSMPATIIPSGGHYVLGDVLQNSFTATEPLATTLTTVAAPARLIYDSSCLQLCAATPAYWGDNALDLWHVRLFVTQEWHFTRAANGTLVGTASENLVPHTITFDLHYDAEAAAWFLGDSRTFAMALEQPLCSDGDVYVQSLYYTPSSRLTAYSPKPLFADHQLNGCLITLTAIHSSQQLVFLWHTAQLYTVNAAAHATEPALVPASPQDLAALR